MNFQTKGLHDSGTNPTDIKFFQETKKTAATTIFFTGKVTGTGKYLYRYRWYVTRYLYRYFVHGPACSTSAVQAQKEQNLQKEQF